jgi:hypothetical protein
MNVNDKFIHSISNEQMQSIGEYVWARKEQ